MKKHTQWFIFVWLAAMYISASGNSLAIGSDSATSDKTQSDLTAAVESVGKDIEKQNPGRKLLYMVLLLQARQPERVVEFYKKHFSHKDPGDLLVRMALIQAYEEKKEYGSTVGILSALSSATRVSPIQARGEYMAGLEFDRKGEDGRPYVKLAVQHDPTFAPAYFQLAIWASTKEESIKHCAATLALVSPDSLLAKKALKLLLKELAAKE